MRAEQQLAVGGEEGGEEHGLGVEAELLEGGARSEQRPRGVGRQAAALLGWGFRGRGKGREWGRVGEGEGEGSEWEYEWGWGWGQGQGQG